MSAWRGAAMAKASSEGFNGALKGLLTAGLAVLPAMSEMDRAMQELRASWSAVQQAAIRHGVAP